MFTLAQLTAVGRGDVTAASFASLVVLLLLLSPPPLYHYGVPVGPASGKQPLGPIARSAAPVVLDGGVVHAFNGSASSTLTDVVRPGASSGTERAYSIEVTVSVPLPLEMVNLTTNPLWEWGQPAQLPGGEDSLPPFADWSWSVWLNGNNDSAAWSLNRTDDQLWSPEPWANSTYKVVGLTRPNVEVTVVPGSSDGSSAPGVGFVSNAGPQTSPSSRSYSALTQLARSLSPSLVRFGLINSGSTVAWNNSTQTPVFNLTDFASTLHWIDNLPAEALLTLPVGTWGDGNTLPVGMPLNLSQAVGLRGGSNGYLPTVAAYAAYVGAVVSYCAENNLTVPFWTIGNEMPLLNASVTAAYIQLFNVASQTIHRQFPGDQVGSDVMTSRSYLPTFAATARGVGFLSFHYYPATTVCDTGAAYCVPNGTEGDPTDPQLWQNATVLHRPGSWEPYQAQSLWYNLTGNLLPIFDAETNLNAGGGPFTAQNGTDPRQDSTFAGAWLVSTLETQAEEHVGALTYYTLSEPSPANSTYSAPYGGWGFGMTSQNTSGGYTYYAPYWALHLWSTYVPAGSPGLITNSSDPNVIRAYSVEVGGNVSIVLVNGVNTSVSVDIRVVGQGFRPASEHMLDASTYREIFNRSVDAVQLVSSAVANYGEGALSGGNFSISGYGVCVVIETPAAPSSSGNGSGGSNQSTNSTSPAPGSGNSTSPAPPTGPGNPGATGLVVPPIHPHGAGVDGVSGTRPPASTAIGAVADSGALEGVLDSGVFALFGLAAVAGWSQGASVGASRPRLRPPALRASQGAARRAAGPPPLRR
jgi:hypothetical protein